MAYPELCTQIFEGSKQVRLPALNAVVDFPVGHLPSGSQSVNLPPPAQKLWLLL